MDTALKNIGFGLIFLGGFIVIFGGISCLVYAIITGTEAVPLVFPVVGIGQLICMSGLLPIFARFFLP